MDNNMTTEQLAEIFVVIESYLKAAYNTDIVTMIEKIKENGNNFFEVLQFILYTEPNEQRLKLMYEYMHDRINGLEVNNPYDFIINSLYEMYTKGLVRIEKEVITMSSLSPNGVSQSKSDKEISFSSRIKNVDDTYSIIDAKLSEEEIKKLIKVLQHNISKYERLYKDKIWLIESEPIDVYTPLKLSPNFKRKEKICITPERFFHLMGLDFKCIDLRNERTNSQVRVNYNELLAVFNNHSKVNCLLDEYVNEDNKIKADEEKNWSLLKGMSLLNLLKELVSDEERFIDYLCGGKLSNIINIPKLYMKSYSFERLGFIEHANGMVMFDKKIAKQNGINTDNMHIGNGIILLKDFILRNKLDFIISLYNKTSSLDTLKIPRNQQTIYISRDGGFNSGIFTGQLSSISSKVSAYRGKDFMYTIKTENNGKPSTVDYFDTHEPLTTITFTDEEKVRMAEILMKMFPQMNNELLNEFLKSNQELLGRRKK